jgi:hypothetical protein
MSLTSLTFLLKTQNLALDLHERHVRRQLMDIVEACAINVLVGEIVQQVAERRDSEFRFQQLGTLRAYAGQVGDGSGEVDGNDDL